MKVTFVIIAAVAAQAMMESQYQDAFTNFQKSYGKEYAETEVNERYNIFKTNLDRIMAHNKGNHSYTMAMNEFGDMTFSEFHGKMTGFIPIDRFYDRQLNEESFEGMTAPAEMDWRSKGVVGPVKNQLDCGSCWAFSTTAVVESAVAIKTGKLYSLSEQQLVDCSRLGNAGCDGGLPETAFNFIIRNGGLCEESAYPYRAVQGSCHTCTKVGHISGYTSVGPSETALQNALAAVGPISIGIEADQHDFQFYASGVFDGVCGTRLDHAVVVVGYGTENGQDYWIVRNSWGTTWGEKGYIRMIRHRNICGIANSACYPKV